MRIIHTCQKRSNDVHQQQETSEKRLAKTQVQKQSQGTGKN